MAGTKKKASIVLCIVAVLLVFGVGSIGGYYVAEGRLPWEEQEAEVVEVSAGTTIDTETIEESLEENGELSTAKYLYTNSVSVTDKSTFEAIGFSDIAIPFSGSTYVLQYDGTIKAGYDLTQATVEVTDDNEVTITLPPAQILSHETGEVEVVYEQQSLINHLQLGEESAWLDEQSTNMEERAISLGLYDDAEENAEKILRGLFASALPDDCELVFVFQDDTTE